MQMRTRGPEELRHKKCSVGPDMESIETQRVQRDPEGCPKSTEDLNLSAFMEVQWVKETKIVLSVQRRESRDPGCAVCLDPEAQGPKETRVSIMSKEFGAY